MTDPLIIVDLNQRMPFGSFMFCGKRRSILEFSIINEFNKIKMWEKVWFYNFKSSIPAKRGFELFVGDIYCFAKKTLLHWNSSMLLSVHDCSFLQSFRKK